MQRKASMRVGGKADIEAWIAAYERAWRTPGTEPLRELFAADGRCREFEEWPFWPGQQIASKED